MKILIMEVPLGAPEGEPWKAWEGAVLEVDTVATRHLEERRGKGETGYLVYTPDALEVLRAMGKTEAVEYWENHYAPFLEFPRAICNIIEP